MKRIYYLSTCDTCKRILKEIEVPSKIEMQDIKTTKISTTDLDTMHALSGSYEALFSKRARLYKERDLKSKSLTELDYRALILEHYTFLKRPVLVYNSNIVIGNSKKSIALAKTILHDE